LKCIKPDRECAFRNEEGFCTWRCPYNAPMSSCEIANTFWGCPVNCIYEIIDQVIMDCPIAKAFDEKLDEIFKAAKLPEAERDLRLQEIFDEYLWVNMLENCSECPAES